MPKPESYIDENGEALELDDAFFKTAKRGRPRLPDAEKKQRVTTMLDADVIGALKGPNAKSWQTRLNAVLRKGLNLD